MNDIVEIKNFDEEIKIFYKDIEIGICKSLLSFVDVREQIAKFYLIDDNVKREEDSDFSFDYNGERIIFRKDSTYDTKGMKFWEDIYIDSIDGILKYKYGWK